MVGIFPRCFFSIFLPKFTWVNENFSTLLVKMVVLFLFVDTKAPLWKIEKNLHRLVDFRRLPPHFLAISSALFYCQMCHSLWNVFIILTRRIIDKYYGERRKENLHCSHSNMAFKLVFFGTFVVLQVKTLSHNTFFFAQQKVKCV